MMRLNVFFAVVVLSSAVSFPSFAAEETPLTMLDSQTKALLSGLDDAQKNEFAAIRNSHGIIRAVEDVQASVQRGVSACGKANVDLKDSLDERLSNWRASIRPVMKQAQTKQEKMILLQNFAKPSVIRNYLKTFDEAVAFRNSAIKEVPVTEHKDCEALLKSMDSTQENLIKLLRENLALDGTVKIKT